MNTIVDILNETLHIIAFLNSFLNLKEIKSRYRLN